MVDHYRTIEAPSEGLFKDRGSKFISYAYPVFNRSAWLIHLANQKKVHLKARHHCYAYRLGLNGDDFRANDDGEPSGTAGKPILGQIDSFNLTNVFIVVVRYFGGTKLGTSGLINAYRTSAALALENADIVEKIVNNLYHIQFDYVHMSNVMNAVKQLELDVVEQEFTDQGRLKFRVRQSESEEVILQLRSKVAQIRLEEIEKIQKIPGFTLTFKGVQ